jgi:hypothetical protein
MNCHEFRKIADSYLSNELLVESNHEVISHLEQCSNCRRELSARRELRSRLRDAFINSPANRLRSELVNELSVQLREVTLGKRSASAASRPSMIVRRTAWLALAACLLLAAVVGLVLLRQSMLAPRQTIGHNGPNHSPAVNPQIPLSIVNTELAKSAVGDHRDCALDFRLKEKPIDLETAGRQFDPVYINLTKAIFSQEGRVPVDAEFVEAHSCVFEGRRFAHIVLKYQGRLVSFLVTDISDKSDIATASTSPSSEPQIIESSQIDGYQVSYFQTARHAVFIVSDLPEDKNLALTRALAPAVFTHISHSESTS